MICLDIFFIAVLFQQESFCDKDEVFQDIYFVIILQFFIVIFKKLSRKIGHFNPRNSSSSIDLKQTLFLIYIYRENYIIKVLLF